MPDYAKAKALAKEFLKCIGDDEEGENPNLPKQDNAVNDGGQEAPTNLDPEFKAGKTGVSDSESDPKKKKKNDASLAVMSSMLAAKVGKSAVN